jgi:hypothetical protein
LQQGEILDKSDLHEKINIQIQKHNIKNDLLLLIHKAFVFTSANSLCYEIVRINHKLSKITNKKTHHVDEKQYHDGGVNYAWCIRKAYAP